MNFSWATFQLLIPPLLIVLGGIVTSYGISGKRKPIVFVGALVSLVGLAVSVHTTNTFQQESTAKGDQISKLNERIGTQADRLLAMQQKLVKKAEESAAKSDEVVELNRKIAKQGERTQGLVTGGSSFCYFEPWPESASQTMVLVLVHRGEFPLYSVSAQIIDRTREARLQKSEAYLKIIEPLVESHRASKNQSAPPSEEEVFAAIRRTQEVSRKIDELLKEARIELSVPMLSPESMLPAANVSMHDWADREQFDIYFYAKNGWWTEQMTCTRYGTYHHTCTLRVQGKEGILLEY